MCVKGGKREEKEKGVVGCDPERMEMFEYFILKRFTNAPSQISMIPPPPPPQKTFFFKIFIFFFCVVVA